MSTTPFPNADLALLLELAAQTGKEQTAILHEALVAYQREWILGEINAAFARVKRDDVAWREEQAERGAWDVTGADALTRDQ